MSQYTNAHGQPIGEPCLDFHGAKRPEVKTLSGQFCYLEPLCIVSHGTDLYQAFALNADNTNWTYLPYGPFTDEETYFDWISEKQQSPDLFFYAIMDVRTKKAVGVSAYLRINPSAGSIEVGHLAFSPLLQRTPLATETQFLLMQYAFDELGYRRYEWKCDSLNAASKNAATRLGFQFEGIFRQALVYKGRSRDTAWLSILDKEWPTQKAKFVAWLSADNFTAGGAQIQRLQDC